MGHLERERLNRTGSTEQEKRDRQKRTGITGKVELDSKTGQEKRNIQNGRDRTRQAE